MSNLGEEVLEDRSRLEEFCGRFRGREDVPKYVAMIGAGAVGGAGIEAGQLYGDIPGGLDAESYGQTLMAGIYTMIFEIGKDSKRKNQKE